jgi:hypothetical protein
VTAVQAPSEPQRGGLLHRLLAHFKTEPGLLLSGKVARFRREQMLAWGIIAGVLGTCLGAGLYFGISQVHWFIHIGSFYWRGFDLKLGWDAGAFWPRWIGHWPVYRHAAFRDLLEPELFVMGVGTLLAKPSHWDDRCGNLRLVTSPVILVVLAVVLNVAGVWLLNFAFGRPLLSSASLGTIILGFAIGHFALRPFWAPVGSLLQGNFIEQRVTWAQRISHVPLWEKLPLMPPVIRERFARSYRAWVPRTFEQDSLLQRVVRRAMPWVLTLVSLGISAFIVLGGMAKYGFAHGWHVAYLYPAH